MNKTVKRCSICHSTTLSLEMRVIRGMLNFDKLVTKYPANSKRKPPRCNFRI